MTSKFCPVKRHCFDKGTCETCAIGKAFEGFNKKIKKLKEKNEKLQVENAELKERIDTLLHPNF